MNLAGKIEPLRVRQGEHMKHFWLNEEQQALMDTATSTAADYGYVGLFSVGKAWKRHVEGMVGSKVDPKDYLRAYNVTGSVYFDHGQHASGWGAKYEVRAIIRLTSKQAMMMKLRHHGSGVAWVREDPTGEAWGNLLFIQAERKNRKGWHSFSHYGFAAMERFLNGGSFGATIANVADHAAGLEPELATAFVRHHFADFDNAHEKWEDPAPHRIAIIQLHHEQTETERYGPLAWEVPGSAWSVPGEIKGKRWAQNFWRKMQNAEERYWAGVE
jgi:hypothetical protein